MSSQFLHFDSLGDVQIVGDMDNLVGDESNLSNVSGNADCLSNSGDGDSSTFAKDNTQTLFKLPGEPLISLQQVRSESPGFEEVIIVQPAEEIISDEAIGQHRDPVVGSDQILVPLSDALSERDQVTPGVSSKGKKSTKRSKKHDSSYDSSRKVSRKWEQRQVQIKTLEGEFSVTMWASGMLIPNNNIKSAHRQKYH